MSIKFRCGACQHAIKAPDEAAGKSVKCPQCGERQKIPTPRAAAPAKTKSKPQAGDRKKSSKREEPDSEAFLQNLDFDKLTDSEVRLCQKCATEIPEGESSCPECGFDPQQLTEAGRKRMKMAAQGIDPSQFYATVWKDSFGFALGHLGLAIKTGVLLAFFFVAAAYCMTFVVWVATTPPYAFWLLLATVSVLIPIGWLVVQHLEVLKLTLARKDELKKLPFDFALCGMYGMKFLAWILIFGLPFWIVFGGLGTLLDRSEVAYGMAIGLGLGAFALLLFTPQAMSHLAMPVEQPGWFFPKIVPTLNVSFLPGLVWVVLFIVVNLPVIGGFALAGYLGGEQIQEFGRIALLEGQKRRGEVMVRLAEGATSEEQKKQMLDEFTDDAALEVPEKNWSSIAMPMTIGVLSCIFLGFSSLVVARANGLFTSCLRKGLDLISQTKEVVWDRKEKEEKVRTRRTTQPAAPLPRFLAGLGDMTLLLAVAGLIGFIVMQLLSVIFESAGVEPESQLAFIIQVSSISVLSLLVFAFYFINTESSTDQGTTLKKAMGLYVCRDDLQHITTGQAVGRFFAFLFLSCILTAGIGNLLSLFREDRKTLHDLLTGTLVRMDKVPAREKS